MYNGWYALKPNQTKPALIYFIYTIEPRKPNPVYLIDVYKQDLALNTQEWFDVPESPTK